MSTPSYYKELERNPKTAQIESTSDVIERVREQSCYRALRVVIWCIVLPGYAASIIMMGAGVRDFLEAMSGRITHLDINPGYAVALGAAAFLVTLAIHQSLRLMADIADLLIEQVRKK